MQGTTPIPALSQPASAPRDTQPAHVVLNSIEALLAPIDDSEHHAAYGYLGFLRGALENDRHRKTLFDKFFQLKNGTPYCAAVARAITVLRSAAEDDARHVAKRGQLLLYWQGTTVFEGAQR